MSKPRLLDLFCGAGGAARGYQMAGFHVTGVDIKQQPRYAGDVFIQGDALEYVAAHGGEYDAIHASPPCQQYTPLRARQGWKEYPDLLDPTRQALLRSGPPWVIENVMTAPFQHRITLCGTMFGLRTYRHRGFESSFMMFNPSHPIHVARTSTKKRRRDFEAGMFISMTGDVGTWLGVPVMGIDWMTGNELSQAIPPAYTAFIGGYLLRQVVVSQEASRG